MRKRDALREHRNVYSFGKVISGQDCEWGTDKRVLAAKWLLRAFAGECKIKKKQKTCFYIKLVGGGTDMEHHADCTEEYLAHLLQIVVISFFIVYSCSDVGG